MHVAVLGGGVIGITTAYYLSELGHSVTVIERESAVATATSYANGGQLSYSYTDSLASPAFLPRIPSLLMGLDPAIRVKILRNAALFPWGLRFLAQCTHAKAKKNTVAVLKLALRSAELIERLQREVLIDFSCKTVGKLVLLATQRDMQRAERMSSLKQQHGCDTQVLTRSEAVAIEPALEHMQQDFAGAVYAAQDQVADAHAFATGLCDWLQKNRRLTLHLGEEVTSIGKRKGRVTHVQTTRGDISVDAAVVCLGPWSSPLLKAHGIRTNLYPVRGYSITLPPGTNTPTVSITDLKHRIVFSQFGDSVRIAGFADFVGWDTRQDKRRIETLLDIAKHVAPDAADYGAQDKKPWGGFRAVMPSGQPQIGRTYVNGLFANIGHGALGWTVACATAEAVARAVSD